MAHSLIVGITNRLEVLPRLAQSASSTLSRRRSTNVFPSSSARKTMSRMSSSSTRPEFSHRDIVKDFRALLGSAVLCDDKLMIHKRSAPIQCELES